MVCIMLQIINLIGTSLSEISMAYQSLHATFRPNLGVTKVNKKKQRRKQFHFTEHRCVKNTLTSHTARFEITATPQVEILSTASTRYKKTWTPQRRKSLCAPPYLKELRHGLRTLKSLA